MRYERHRPEHTPLYGLVEKHYPKFLEELDARGESVPAYVRREFEAYLACGRLEHGFLRVRCEQCRAEKLVAFSCKGRGFCPSCGAARMVGSAALLMEKVFPRQPVRQWVLSLPFELRFLLAREPGVLSRVLGIIYRAIEGHLLRQAGFTRASARSGAVTLVQRFGSALNLNVHLHILFLDGVYEYHEGGQAVFHPASAPTGEQLRALLLRISRRMGRYLERSGWLTREAERVSLTLEPGDEQTASLDRLRACSITYRIALGAHQGKKAFTLQSVPASPVIEQADVAQANGFSLHAGVWAGANDRAKLERLCRYIARPAVSNERLEFTDCGHVRYELKTAYRDGTTHVYFNPLDFIARLAALVPKPRANLTRFHGIFAPNSALRSQVTPSGRGRGRVVTEAEATTPAERYGALCWAQRLKRVFNLDVERCEHCGGAMKIIAAIEDPAVIAKILQHLETHPPRGPPPRERGAWRVPAG